MQEDQLQQILNEQPNGVLVVTDDDDCNLLFNNNTVDLLLGKDLSSIPKEELFLENPTQIQCFARKPNDILSENLEEAEEERHG